MKLISLNTWGCRVTKSVFEFIRQNMASTDIFCLQEILKGGKGSTSRGEIASAYEYIKEMLPSHTAYFSEYIERSHYNESPEESDFKFGLSCFVRSDLKQSFVEDIKLLDAEKRWNDYSGRFAGGTAMAIEVNDFTVINLHGLWQNSIKEDTEAKIEQSKKIIDLADRTGGRKIICGDFNLLPDTKSINTIILSKLSV